MKKPPEKRVDVFVFNVQLYNMSRRRRTLMVSTVVYCHLKYTQYFASHRILGEERKKRHFLAT